MQPLISVIVPVYNGRDYLANCIESIEAQTYGNLELLLIDDGSDDGTDEVCRRLAQAYPNIRVTILQDEGVSTARNTGLELAAGEYVTFVDADDRLLPDTLTVLHQCIQKTGSDVAGCGFLSFHTQEEWERLAQRAAQELEEEQKQEDQEADNCRWAARCREYDRESFLREALLGGNSRCWSKLYKRAAVEKVRFCTDLTIGEDMLFLVDLLPKIGKICETEYRGYGYFQNPGGAMNREFQPGYMDQITCWEKARERICRMDADLYVRVTTILLMAILLTAGKLAMLSRQDRRTHRQSIALCHEKLAKEIRVRKAVLGLSLGYRAKAALFGRLPQVYLWLYHFRKYRK